MIEINEILKKKHELLLEADELYFKKLAMKSNDPRKQTLAERIETLEKTANALQELAEKLADLDYSNEIYERLM